MATHVYIDTRNDTGLAFYVGIGSDKRVNHLKRNIHHSNVVIKAGGFKRTIVESFENRQDALALEVYLIASYGLGNLTNMTLGGDGRRAKHATLADKLAADKKAMVKAKANFEAKTDMRAYKAAAQRRWTTRQKEKLNA